MISIDDFKSLANASNGKFHLDLSVLDKNLIEPILNSIETYGPNIIEVFSITCIKLVELEEDVVYPPYVVNSIAINVPQYIKYFISRISNLLACSQKLQEIHFIGIRCDSDDLINICRAIKQSQSLKLVDFTDIPIGNRIIKEMTYHISFNGEVQYLYFRSCDLTNDCISLLVNYVTAVRRRFGEKGLLEIDLSGNDITEDEFSKVIEALNNFEEKSEIQLEIENQKLREEIEKMQEMVREIKEHGKLFIVGDGADELIQHMKEIEERISFLEK